MAKKKVAKKKVAKKRPRRSRKPRKAELVKITVELSRRQAKALRELAKICSGSCLSGALKKIVQSIGG